MSRGDLTAMEVTPPWCACGEGRAARQDVKDRFPDPGRCHICRMIAMQHKDWPDDRVAAAGKRLWIMITRKQEAA